MQEHTVMGSTLPSLQKQNTIQTALFILPILLPYFFLQSLCELGHGFSQSLVAGYT